MLGCHPQPADVLAVETCQIEFSTARLRHRTHGLPRGRGSEGVPGCRAGRQIECLVKRIQVGLGAVEIPALIELIRGLERAHLLQHEIVPRLRGGPGQRSLRFMAVLCEISVHRLRQEVVMHLQRETMLALSVVKAGA